MFWVVMTLIAAGLAVTYGVVGCFGHRWGISAERARKFRTASYLAAGWAAVCVGHLLVRH